MSETIDDFKKIFQSITKDVQAKKFMDGLEAGIKSTPMHPARFKVKGFRTMMAESKARIAAEHEKRYLPRNDEPKSPEQPKRSEDNPRGYWLDRLGLPKEATPEQIKIAYRELARKYHPDTNPGSTWASKRFQEIQEAYEHLR